MRLALIVVFGVIFCARADSYHFVQVTDIHMEPFYNPEFGHAKGDVCRCPEAFNKSQCTPFVIEPIAKTYPLGRLNCDGPEALLHSLLAHIDEVSKHVKPEFAIFTGDIPSHQLSCQRHQVHTIEFVVRHLAERLKPAVGVVYPVMGNNDYFPNYNISLDENNPWQELVAEIYERNGLLAGEQLTTFRRGGFYSVKPKPGLRLIVLNTVVLSQKVLDWGRTTKKIVNHIPEPDEGTYAGPNAPLRGADDSGWEYDTEAADKKEMVSCDARPEDPYGQLAWMQGELENAKQTGERVIIAGHVPPGNKVGDNNFCQRYTWRLSEISNQYADIIEVQLYGDHSNDEFRMFWQETPTVKAVSSILVSAGITPRKHCNPSWRMFEVTDKHDVHDFTQYYLPLEDSNLDLEEMRSRLDHGEWDQNAMAIIERKSVGQWKKQYSFRQEYGVGLEPYELEIVFERLQKSPKLLRKYVANMFSQTAGTVDYFDYVCDMRYLGEEANERCAQKGRLSNFDEPASTVHHRSKVMSLSTDVHGNGDKLQIDSRVFLALQIACASLVALSIMLFAKVVQLKRANHAQCEPRHYMALA